MADLGRSSFIPKETAGLTPGKVRRKQTFHVFGFVATIMIVGSLALAAGVYFLKSSAESNLEEARQALSEQQSIFDANSINEIREFDRRLRAAEILLAAHIAPLKIFAALEAATKQRVQFTSFTLEHSPSLEVYVTLAGVTEEFTSLALQEIQFSDHQLLRDVLFKEVALKASGEDELSADTSVTFSLAGYVDLGKVQYDGIPVFTKAPVEFVETGDELAVEEGMMPAVLGETVTETSI